MTSSRVLYPCLFASSVLMYVLASNTLLAFVEDKEG